MKFEINFYYEGGMPLPTHKMYVECEQVRDAREIFSREVKRTTSLIPVIDSIYTYHEPYFHKKQEETK